ncbi:MAG TPA: recombinase family protein, partial [Dehalococcoidia bacterium]|nr:recombinase family protein [Dehalococcoidia bacterium]
MRAIGYFRELASDEAGGESIARQNDAFLKFCKRQGYEAAATFLDSASSNGDRPGLRQLLSYLRRPEKGFVVIVVAGLDRLGDSPRDAARAFFQIESLGTQLVMMDQPGDSLAQLLDAWGAAQAREHVGDRVREAMRRKAVRGEVLGRPPYGYRVGLRRKLELVPEEAAIVRYVFRLYLHEGLGIRLIVQRM